MLKKGYPFIFLLALLLITSIAEATHIRAGEITVERQNCQSLTFTIYITAYLDPTTGGCGGAVEFGGGTLDFGDGSDPIEGIDGHPSVDTVFVNEPLGECIVATRYKVEHTYSSSGTYIIRYNEANRNDGILNMDNSVNTKFYIESVIRIDPFFGCNNSPAMLIPPIDYGCVGVAFYHNPGAFDIDGDSIAFEFVTPRKAVGTDVDNYRQLNDESFGGLTEDQTGLATLSIDPVTGDIVWNSPGRAGEYNVAFVVKEYRKIAGQFFLIGSVVRDMQIVIEDCDNNRPELEIPDDICVEAGTNIQELIIARDIDNDDVLIEAFSAVFFFPDSPASFQSPIAGQEPSFQPQPGQALFEWQTTCEHIRDQPYLVTFKVTDNPPQGVSLVEFKTMNITVVAPAPRGLASTVNADRTIDLTWDDYSCTNAESIQVWRRVDSFNLALEDCVVGMPENAGYTLIDVIPATSTSYTDDNDGRKLAFDANYCYRLVATFPLPRGGESYVSTETCGLIRADGPAITHVTVDETSQTTGKVTISWRGPFEIDQSLFPPPYQYELWRGTGFADNVETRIMTLSSDTTFQDTGLDTERETYHYEVRLFDNSGEEVRRSVTASQVRLEPAPLNEKIELHWFDNVPWTHNSQAYPIHYIYRDNVLPNDLTTLVLYDSVNVNENGFTYLDDREVLDEETDYGYYIEAYGTYGNPSIIAPQINLSQIVYARPNDDVPPVVPELFIQSVDCIEFLADKDCDFSSFFNIIYWDPGESTDIKEFEVFYSTTGLADTYTLIATVSDTVFLHNNIPSYKGCYKVVAIDRSGNRSDESNVVCNDNCPYYELPNVFTPNDDGANDVFRPLDEFSDAMNAQCPRFVKSVDFKVYNRWGVLLYEYQSGGENTIYINWNGSDTSGNLLPAGMYYYSADVVYDILPSSEPERTLRGWVQILY